MLARHWGFALVALIALSCSRTDSNGGGPEREAEESPSAIPPPPRPATKILTVSLEGAEQQMTARLFLATDAGLSLPFSTYVPEDMVVSAGHDSVGEFARFVAAFGGVRNEDAHVTVFVLPVATDSATAFARFHDAVNALATIPPQTLQAPRQAWTREEFRLVRSRELTTQVGWAGLAEHDDRWFFAIQMQPEEYLEGMGPRAGAIWREWRWEDTGAGL